MKFVFNPLTGQCEGIEREEDENVHTFATKEEVPLLQVFRNFFDRFVNTKESLLADVFNMSGNDSYSDLVALEKAIETFMTKKKIYDDEQLLNAIEMARLYQVESLNNEAFEEMYHRIESAIFRLMRKEHWDEVDTLQSSRICGHAIDFDTLEKFSERIISEARERESKDIELTTRMNMQLRLVRMRYGEVVEIVIHEKVSKLFQLNSKIINNICDEKNYPIFKIMNSIRDGMFHKDFKKIRKGIDDLRNLGKNDRADNFAEEVNSLFKINIEGRKKRRLKNV